MGFRNGAYATVWSTQTKSDKLTKVRISISHKDKTTNEYITDFSDFVSFVGTECASKALTLKQRDRIKLNDVDVYRRYDKEKDRSYYNCYVYSFDSQQGFNYDNVENATQTKENTNTMTNANTVDSGEIEPADDDLPF